MTPADPVEPGACLECAFEKGDRVIGAAKVEPGVMSEPLAAVPTLPTLPQDVLDRLPVRALVDLRRQLHHMTAEVEAALAHRLAAPSVIAPTAPPPPPEIRADDVRAYTTGDFACRL